MTDTPTTPAPPPPEALTDPFVVVPYVRGMLREETRAAVAGWGGYYTFHPVNPADPYAYAWALHGWWKASADLIVIEQDIVPAAGMIREMAQCPHEWCVRPYCVGPRHYTTGLGMCKISKRLRNRFPHASDNIIRDPTGRKPARHYLGLNEAVERQLTRYGASQHVHYPVVSHLKYSEYEIAA